MSWLWFALFTTIAWGVWGALIEIPGKKGEFPAMLGYMVWACTMIPCALIALSQRQWKLDLSGKAIVQGCLVGFLGAGGQLVLFRAAEYVPAYLLFPVVSLYPVVTVMLAVTFLRERATLRQWAGVALAIPAMVLLSIPAEQKPEENQPKEVQTVEEAPAAEISLSELLKSRDQRTGWFLLGVGVLVAWGIQAYFMKTATQFMSAEGLFFYMAATAVLLMPIAYSLTTVPESFSWKFEARWDSPWTVAGIQVLNSIGALSLVCAMRTGKAMVVAPMTALAPVITVVLSLLIYEVRPDWAQATGIVLASIAIYLLAE